MTIKASYAHYINKNMFSDRQQQKYQKMPDQAKASAKTTLLVQVLGWI